MLLAPVLILLIAAESRTASLLAAGLFVLAAATDGLDGYLARRYDSTTRTGQWLDPLADKFLVLAPVVALTALGDFPWWGAVIIVARESTISGLRVLLGLRGRGMPASRAAKVKTTLQLAAITLYILPLSARFDPLKVSLLTAALALTVITGIDYLIRARREPAPPLPEPGQEVGPA